LSLAFERRETEKAYLAIVTGRLDPPNGAIDTPLHEARRGRMRPARPDEPGALDALTAYTTKAVWDLGGGTVTLVEALPRTGRHHQIRVHFRSVGTPLLFDGIYGGSAGAALAAALQDAPARRLALHACRLTVPSPGGAGRLQIESTLPADLTALVRWLD
jgi:23S rRNA-/tRNA-specific pseudouridylate synthase